MQPGTAGGASAPAMNQSAAQSGAMQGQFMSKLQPDQIMASELIGTRVMSANNESIGDINDVIVDRNGKAVAAIVGVGGFLGIGEKDVAVPFEELEFVSSQQARAMDSNAANAPATTGSTAPGAAGSTTNMAANNAAADDADDRPERVVLRMTKAELQAAPSFDADGDDDNANRSTTGSAGAPAQPRTMAPAPTAPKQ
jgi:sporulation protein YlmC with PRC-barrel domain